MCAVSNCRNVLVKVGHDNVFDAVYRDFEAKKSPGRKGSFSEGYRTSYLVLSSSVGCHFKSMELDDPLPITPLNDFDLTSKC